MFLHLNDVNTEKPMLQGRWKSTAFLTYIRVQVLGFSAGLSGLMNNTRDFYTVPETNFDQRELNALVVPHRYNPYEAILARTPGIMEKRNRSHGNLGLPHADFMTRNHGFLAVC